MFDGSIVYFHGKPDLTGRETKADLMRSPSNIGRRCVMETQHTETVVDKAVNFVKDVLGIQHDDAPEVVANPEYLDSETAAENASGLDPNSHRMQSLEQLNAEP